MTAIFIIALLVFIFFGVNGHRVAYAKPAKAMQPAKVMKVNPSFFQRLKIALYGEKVLIAELCRCDGDWIKHRTHIRVQWVNSTTCNAEDGFQYHQLLMVLEDGKRLSLPIAEDKDGKYWVTYQGQQYNRWDSAVQVRRGLLAVFRGDGCKVKPVALLRDPVFG